ncbi:MAG: DUF5686 family protein [Bacteroidia bacterium]
MSSRYLRFIYSFLLLLLLSCSLHAQQEITIQGRVTEQGTNDGMPYVNVYFNGTLSGTTTDFDGNYTLKAAAWQDSLTARYLGYKLKRKKVRNTDKLQIIDFQLIKDSRLLEGVVIHPGINPAIRIVQNAVDAKSKYDKTGFGQIRYKSYTKTEADIDKMTKKIRKWKLFAPLVNMYDSMDVMAGESKANLPVYFSEVVSDIYYQKTPRKKRENVKAVRINFVGKKDGSAASQLTGSDFDNYNFYSENVEVLKKPFISPFADNAMTFYHYYLVDSELIGKFYCYKINVVPKILHDAAFKGYVWITDSTWAVKQIDLEIPKEANFDLVERVHVQQELVPTEAGPWMPAKTRILIDYIDLTDHFVSLVLKVYQSSSDFNFTDPKPPEFFEKLTNFAEDALLKNQSYWDSLRPERLSGLEEMNYRVIDTVRHIPFIKHGVNVLYFLALGYVTAGPVDFGHYINLYSNNSYEGDRYRVGIRTNDKVSKSWILSGYGAYGTKDKGFKYNAQVEHIIARFPWTKAGAEYRDDVERVGSTFNYAGGQSVNMSNNILYNTTYGSGDLRQFVRKNEARTWYERELKRGIMQRITFQNIRTFPLFPFTFGTDPWSIFQQKNYSITELVFDTHISMGELFIQNGNQRMQVGASKKPIIDFNYTMGIKGLFGSDFEYNKVSLGATQRVKWGILGVSTYNIQVGKVFSAVPYTLLQIHRGNETPFFATTSFNTMNYYEFVSDQFAEVHLQHYFMGLLFNRIPLIKRLNLREVISCNAAYGFLSDDNKNFNINNNFSQLNKMPYLEAGAGVTNIFDLFRIDFIYRCTYTDQAYMDNYHARNPGTSIKKWAVKVGVNFML